MGTVYPAPEPRVNGSADKGRGYAPQALSCRTLELQFRGVDPRSVHAVSDGRTMSNESGMPPTARCLRCGYLLRGLPTPVCPECGRAFEPADASTYDLRPPGWRRRQWIKAGVFFALILFVFAPRGLMKGTLSFTCPACGERTTYSRWELRPPSWIPIRYPGFGLTSRGLVASDSSAPACPHAQRTLNLQFDFRLGSANSRGTYVDGEFPTFNGHLVTLTNGPDVLKHVMAPSSIGIGP